MTPDTFSPSLLQTLGRFRMVEAHRPWPRYEVGMTAWAGLVEHLQTVDWSLVGLWASKLPPGAGAASERAGEVHMALRDETSGEIAVVSLACPDGRFPSVSAARPGAIRLERAIRDLFGIETVGLDDTRAWLDHGRWPLRHPLASSAAPRPGEPAEAASYEFLAAGGDGVALHQVPVGPVHAGIIEPGHFRFTCLGETVVRLEERLGYTHKGVEALMEGRTAAEAARLAARVSGDSTVAYGIAFARAVEAALGVEVPPRAVWLRALMAEMERIANHLGDIGAICNDVAFAFLHAHLATWRERVLQASDACFGHRLMMDRVVPGGVTVDLSPEGRRTLGRLLSELRPAFRDLVRIYDDKPSLSDRVVGTGSVTTTLVHRFGAGGFVGRATLRGQDARTSPAYPPYDDLEFDVPVLGEGDVNARVWVRIREVQASLGLMEQILLRLPESPTRIELPATSSDGVAEGMALVEGFRGEILVWVRLGSDGRILRCHPRDPSWFQWPLLEATIEDNIIADFPVCNKSFNCSYSGHDL